jgi:hypothetical protein
MRSSGACPMTSIHLREWNLSGNPPENKTMTIFRTRTVSEIEKLNRVVENVKQHSKSLGNGSRVLVPLLIYLWVA